MVNEETVLWLTVPNHFQWRHEHKQSLPHRKTKTMIFKNSGHINVLDGFLNETQDSFLFSRAGIATQTCESFHSLKGRLVTKDCA
jgi:uncharacterized protein with WD repeat